MKHAEPKFSNYPQSYEIEKLLRKLFRKRVEERSMAIYQSANWNKMDNEWDRVT